jgi:hypothetical protein
MEQKKMSAEQENEKLKTLINIEQSKKAFEINGEFRYALLSILTSMNENLAEMNKVLKEKNSITEDEDTTDDFPEADGEEENE